MKITNWTYDDGQPVYSPTINAYTSYERKPCWRCSFWESEIAKWVVDQRFRDEEDYSLAFRFNSGDPRHYLTIYNEELAAAFALRWT